MSNEPHYEIINFNADIEKDTVVSLHAVPSHVTTETVLVLIEELGGTNLLIRFGDVVETGTDEQGHFVNFVLDAKREELSDDEKIALFEAAVDQVILIMSIPEDEYMSKYLPNHDSIVSELAMVGMTIDNRNGNFRVIQGQHDRGEKRNMKETLAGGILNRYSVD